MSAALKLNTHKHNDDQHDHNCACCHHHHEQEEKTNTKSLSKKIHEHNGHQCIDPHCDIEAPHGHNRINHDGHNHDHQHHSHDCNHSFPVWPLEDFISHAKIPHWLREFSLNSSFLSPAMLVSTVLEHVPMPKLLKTWSAITAMHIFNRGKQKLPRLGLTYLISGAANAGAKTSLGAKLSRFLATSAVAFVEKFSGNGHHHGKEDLVQMTKRDITSLFKNLKSKKQWLELLPSLVNIEAKVQVVAPLVSKLIHKISSKFSDTTKSIFNLITSIIFTSLGFVAADKLLIGLVKALGGENSSFAASLSSICGCCGSPVCSAAATDTALSNSM